MDNTIYQEVVEVVEDVVHDLEKQKMYDAMEALDLALNHDDKMMEQVDACRAEYENNKMVMGPLYGELCDKLRKANEAYAASEQAVIEATKKLSEAEAEYYKNLKCTFCGDLDSICGGDHSFEMRWDAQNR
jgi:hypothetical protein